MMPTLTLRLSLAILLLTAAAGRVSLSGQTQVRLTDADLRSAVITMTREMGGIWAIPDATDIGQDASYSVSIAGDGTVTFIGKWGVRTIGRRSHKIAVESVRALLVEFEQRGFWSLNDRYENIDLGNGMRKTTSDLAHATVAISVAGRTKSVYDYEGTPAVVKRLETRIDEVADTHRYTGRPPIKRMETTRVLPAWRRW